MTTTPDPPRYDGAGDPRGDYDDFLGDPAADARARLTLPATLLLGGTALTLLPCFVALSWGVAMLAWGASQLLFGSDPLEASRAEERMDAALPAAVGGLIGSAYLGTIAVGARRMRQFRRFRLARTAAILGMISVVPLQLASVFVLPFAVWCFVVMRDPLVKSQFRSS